MSYKQKVKVIKIKRKEKLQMFLKKHPFVGSWNQIKTDFDFGFNFVLLLCLYEVVPLCKCYKPYKF